MGERAGLWGAWAAAAGVAVAVTCPSGRAGWERTHWAVGDLQGRRLSIAQSRDEPTGRNALHAGDLGGRAKHQRWSSSGTAGCKRERTGRGGGGSYQPPIRASRMGANALGHGDRGRLPAAGVAEPVRARISAPSVRRADRCPRGIHPLFVSCSRPGINDASAMGIAVEAGLAEVVAWSGCSTSFRPCRPLAVDQVTLLHAGHRHVVVGQLIIEAADPSSPADEASADGLEDIVERPGNVSRRLLGDHLADQVAAVPPP